jgi:ribosome-binding protein aMBF1 (putative translation factor)
MNNADYIIERMKKLLGLQNDNELAERLNKHSSTIATWRHRNRVPMNVVKEFCNNEGISLKEFDEEKKLKTVREKLVKMDDNANQLYELINKLRLNPGKLNRAIGYLESLLEDN